MLAPLLVRKPDCALVSRLDCLICEAPGVPWLPTGYTTVVYQLPFSMLRESQQDKLAQSVYDYSSTLDLEEGQGSLGVRRAWSFPHSVLSNHRKTLFMIAAWESEESERENEKTKLYDILNRAVLQKADSDWEKYHIHWDVLYPDFMEHWKISENPRWPYKPEAK